MLRVLRAAGAAAAAAIRFSSLVSADCANISPLGAAPNRAALVGFFVARAVLSGRTPVGRVAPGRFRSISTSTIGATSVGVTPTIAAVLVRPLDVAS